MIANEVMQLNTLRGIEAALRRLALLMEAQQEDQLGARDLEQFGIAQDADRRAELLKTGVAHRIQADQLRAMARSGRMATPSEQLAAAEQAKARKAG